MDSVVSVPLDHPSAKNRFVLDPRTRQLVKLPSGLLDVLTLWTKPQGRGQGMLKGFLKSILSESFRSKKLARSTRSDSSSTPNKCQTLLQTQTNDTSVDNLVRRTLGPRIADTLISAMVHGIYATDARLLSVRSAFPVLWQAVQSRGSLLLGLLFPSPPDPARRAAKQAEEEAWKSLGSLDSTRKQWSVYGFRGGLETLTRGLTDELHRLGVDIKLGHRLQTIQPTADGCTLTLEKDNGSKVTLDTSLVLSCIGPRSLAPALSSSHSAGANLMTDLTYNPSTTVGLVNLVFPAPASQIHPPGFGYLVPRSTDSVLFPPPSPSSSQKSPQPSSTSSNPLDNPNPGGIIGVVFDSTSITGVETSPLVASHLTKLTVMMGGPHWSSYPAKPLTDPSSAPIPIPTDPNALISSAMTHLRSVFPHIPDPIISEAAIHHDCIPTYLVGHGQRLARLDQKIASCPEWANKLVLVGSGYGGVGVNDCVGMAEDVVADLDAAWENTSRGTVITAPVTGLERWRDWQ